MTTDVLSAPRLRAMLQVCASRKSNRLLDNFTTKSKIKWIGLQFGRIVGFQPRFVWCGDLPFVPRTTALQPNHENPDVCRRHAGNARCLTNGSWTNSRELLTRFHPQTGDCGIIKFIGSLLSFQAFEFGDIRFLPVNEI